jgi:hypothetical protein
MDRFVKEAIQIRLNINGLTRDGGFILSRTGYTAIDMLIEKQD